MEFTVNTHEIVHPLADAIGDTYKDDIVEAIVAQFTCRDIAEEISISDIADEISARDIAWELDISKIANAIDNDDLASEIDMAELANEINMCALADLVAEVGEFASEVAACIKLTSIDRELEKLRSQVAELSRPFWKRWWF